MSTSQECYKIDMGCECYPAPPDKPRPFVFSFVNDSTEASSDAVITFNSNAAGAIIGYTISSTGASYRIAPTITIGGAGTLATATCTINALGQVTSVTITAGGSGYGAGVSGITSTITPGANNLITFDQLKTQISLGVAFAATPVQRLSLPIPAGAGVTLANAKIQVKLTYTVKTNGVTDLTGTFYVNGIAQSTPIVIDDTSATYTTVTHYSGELTLNYADTMTYKITSTENKLYDISFVSGNYYVKYI